MKVIKKEIRKDIIAWFKELNPWLKEKELVLREDIIRINYLNTMIKNYQKQVLSLKEQIKLNKISLTLTKKIVKRKEKEFGIKL